MKRFETVLNSFGALIGITIIVMLLVALTSCATRKCNSSPATWGMITNNINLT